MSNFRFNYNDIHKQVAIADLSDEQIQELFTLLQTKRSAKPQLTREEKAFFQCCREHRSYANNKDTNAVVCPHCGSVKSIKHGTRNGRQRYFCKDCHKTFGDTNGTVAFRSKLSVAQWIEFIKMTLQGESCRTIAKELGINKQTALHNRHRVCSVLHQLVSNQDDFKSLAESDEYYYPLSFKDIKDPMFFLSTLGRMPYTHLSYWKKIKYVKAQGFDIDFLHTYIKNEEQNKDELSAYAYRMLDLFKKSKLNFISCPTENVYLQGRQDTYPKRRGITRVKEFKEYGINVAFAQDSINDPWYPMGNGNMMNVLDNGIHLAQIMSSEDIKTDLDLITINGARCLNIQDRYGLDAGKDANFIVLDGDSPYDVIRNRAGVLASVRKGEYLFKQKSVEYDVKLDLGI